MPKVGSSVVVLVVVLVLVLVLEVMMLVEADVGCCCSPGLYTSSSKNGQNFCKYTLTLEILIPPLKGANGVL